MRPSLSLLCFFLACGVLIGARTTNAQQQQQQVSREYDLKATYFHFFGLYIQWPRKPFAGADKEFVIAVLGSNSFGQRFPRVGKGFAIKTNKMKIPVTSIQGKTIKVVQYRSVDEFKEKYRPCHILFISRFSAPGAPAETPQDRVNAALEKTKGQPVLLVGEASNMVQSQRLARSGVIICYWKDFQADRLKMHINQTDGARNGLSIRSPLLRLSIVTAF